MWYLAQAQRLAHVGYWDRDLDGGRLTLSDESCHIFGLPPQRHVDLAQWHEPWLQLIHPEDRPKIAEASATALRGGPPYDVEYRVLRPSGDVRIVRSRAEVTWDESGRPRRMFGVMQDITDLRRAEERFRAMSERFRAMAESSLVGIYVVQERAFRYVNPAMARTQRLEVTGAAPGVLRIKRRALMTGSRRGRNARTQFDAGASRAWTCAERAPAHGGTAATVRRRGTRGLR